MVKGKRVAIIGAGASGLPAIRHALLYQLDVTCFEAAPAIGGLWRFKAQETDESSVMKSTVINTSKEMTAYSDFPPLPEMPNFMHNRELLRYFQMYAEHYQLNKYIKFNHKVIRVERAEDYAKTGRWTVSYTTPDGTKITEIFDAVLMCSGHHKIPNMPKAWEGQEKFKGQIIHSHSYKDHKGYEDKVVVAVGVGNSGGDVAVELSRIARQVYLVTRRGTWVFNRVYDYGMPFDVIINRRFANQIRSILPFSVTNYITEAKLNHRFDHARYGLKPKHNVFGAHPTVNDELPTRIASGTIKVKPNIRRFTETGIEFDDRSFVDGVDAVIMSTGYSFEFNLVEDGKLIPVSENQVDLYEYMYPLATADHNSLAIIGLIQPVGSIMPISEMQARVFFDSLYGNSKLPSKEKMIKSIDAKKAAITGRYVKSPRHTIQVDYIDYMDELADHIGCKPNLVELVKKDPALAYQVEFGPAVSYSYRLQGPHPWEGAKDAILTSEERMYRATNSGPYVSGGNCGLYMVAGVLLLILVLFSFLCI